MEPFRQGGAPFHDREVNMHKQFCICCLYSTELTVDIFTLGKSSAENGSRARTKGPLAHVGVGHFMSHFFFLYFLAEIEYSTVCYTGHLLGRRWSALGFRLERQILDSDNFVCLRKGSLTLGLMYLKKKKKLFFQGKQTSILKQAQNPLVAGGGLCLNSQYRNSRSRARSDDTPRIS